MDSTQISSSGDANAMATNCIQAKVLKVGPISIDRSAIPPRRIYLS